MESIDRENAVNAMRQMAPDAFWLQPLPLSHKIPIWSSAGSVVRQEYTLWGSSITMLLFQVCVSSELLCTVWWSGLVRVHTIYTQILYASSPSAHHMIAPSMQRSREENL